MLCMCVCVCVCVSGGGGKGMSGSKVNHTKKQVNDVLHLVSGNEDVGSQFE